MGQNDVPSDIQVSPLSYGQKALWLLYSLSPGRAAYNMIYSWRIRGALNVDALKKAVQTLTDRHPSLRSTYATNDKGEPQRHIHPHLPPHFDDSDATGWSEQMLEQVMSSKIYRPINLETGPLLRWSLLKRSDDEHILLMTIHHIASDKWSIMIMMNDLSKLYSAYIESDPRPLAELGLSQSNLEYTEFVDWQKEMLEGKKGDRLLKFWQEQLAGEIPTLNLTTDKLRPPTVKYRCEIHTVPMPQELSTKLQALAESQNTSMYTLLLSAFHTLLHRYSGQDDILIGTPTAGRSLKYDGIAGYFVSPIMIRGDFQGATSEDGKEEPLSFKDFLQRSHKTVSASLRRWDYPFPMLVEQLHPDRDQSRSPFTQVYFTLDNPNLFMDPKQPMAEMTEDGVEVWKIGGNNWERLEPISLLHDFDLYLRVNQVGDFYSINLEYSSDLFDKPTIERMVEHYQTLLTSAVENPDQKLSELSILTKAEEHRLLVEWNQTDVKFPFEICSHHWFERQVDQKPDSTALIVGEDEYSYAELNRRSNQIAHHLISQGLALDELVGIYMDRSYHMIAGIMAVVKAGGAYVPLDPKYPEDRINMILKASELKILLTQQSLLKYLPDTLTNICLDTLVEASEKEDQNPSVGTTLRNLSHLIYTSGSTGTPKGIAIEHGNVSALINWTAQVYSEEELSGVLGSTSICFDLSVYEIFGTLGLGGTLILADNALHLSSLPAVNRVKLLNTVPSAAKELLRMEAIPSSVTTINLAGEPLTQAVVQNLYGLSHIKSVYDLYGPSEDTTYSTYALMERGEKYMPLIGRPLPNTQAYVVDANMNPTPQGVPGELYLGGMGLARGYFKRPDLTEERFIPNPFDPERSARIYQTGDLVRYLPDGSLDYIGRVDHQVKIRGFRIELGDIESCLYQHPTVHETIVMVQELPNDEKILISFAVLKEGHETDNQTLRSFVQENLPEYMVPTQIFILDAMPLNPNGKIDRKALAVIAEDVKQKDPTASVGHVEPQGGVETTIAEVWQNVLHLEHIGIHDNFFDLGGHSLLMAQVYSQLPDVLKKDLSVVDLFQYPTIYKLAEYLGDEQDPDTMFQEKDDRVERTRRARERLKDMPGLKIAIVGLGGKFPGAESVDQFWDNIVNGVESIARFSDEEMENERISPEMWQHPNYVKASGQLEGIDMFDANFFGFTPREAQITDPQHRLFLECAWETLENTGVDPERYKGSIGVYAGSGSSSYFAYNIAPHASLLQTIGRYPILMANDKDYLCSRVSYKLNLEGPGVTVQTACSTSLVAVHLACRGLLSGECDLALAGGVSLGELQKGYLYQEGMILSPDGKCRPFDAKAKGTVPGQGVGLVALKRLEDALDDGDAIEAVIIGSAINNDGSNKIGYSAPGVEGQAHAIQSAHVMAGVPPETIHYVESHGTGTFVGDPIEFAGLTQAFRAGTEEKQFCAIGSAKSNIGHLDSASGVTGLIKGALALKHQTLPPSLNFEEGNPTIDFENSPFYVNTRRARWHKDEDPRRAGVSSFGLGGTNAHVILEEAPTLEPTGKARPRELLTFSAKTPTALAKMADNLAEFLNQDHSIDIADVAFTLHLGRTAFSHRKTLVVENLHEAILELKAKNPQKISKATISETEPPLTFMFSGQGSQYVNMWHQLYQVEATFREAVNECQDVLKRELPEVFHTFTEQDLKAETDKIHETRLTQVILFITEYSMARLLKEWGLNPTSMIGHSIGEYVAACMAGVFSLDDVIPLVALRGQLVQDKVEAGDMLSVRDTADKVKELIESFSSEHEVSLAAVNSSTNCVVSGPEEAVKVFKEYCEQNEIQCRKLYTSHAFHSMMLDPILEEFENRVKTAKLNAPQIPFVSNVTGTWITDEEATDPNYWVRHLRGTVNFSDGVETLMEKDPNMILLEVGPGKVLSTLARQNAQTTPKTRIFSTLHHPQEEQHDTAFLLTTLGRLWAEGVTIDWDGFHSHESRTRIPLPTYPFERKRFWIDPPKVTTSSEASLETPTLDEEEAAMEDTSELAEDAPKTPIERTIAKVWSDFLGVDEITLHDDFFELGGDSMLAVGLLSKLQDVLDVPLSSHILMNRTTIAGLSEFVEEEKATHHSGNAEEKVSSLVVELQKGNPTLPRVVLIHPGGGNIYFYRDMAHHLGAEHPICAIQARGLDGKEEPIDDIKAMAAYYIGQLQAFQPEGPYILGGSSFGGLVAHEMAHQLEAQGQTIPLVFMVDSPSPGHMPIPFDDDAHILVHLFGDMIPLSVEKLRTYDTEGQIQHVIEQATIVTKNANLLPADFGPSYLKMVNAHLTGMYAFEPHAYSGQIVFYKHTEPTYEYDANPELGWMPVVEKELIVMVVPGSHITMNAVPHVKVLCKHLRNEIDLVTQSLITDSDSDLEDDDDE